MGLRGAAAVAILRVRFTARLKSQRNQRVVVAVLEFSALHGREKEVDDERETLHNLTSLLLTNKTIRRTQQGSTEYEVL